MDLSTENSLFYHHSHFEDRWAFLGLIVRSQETFGRLYWVKIDQESTYHTSFYSYHSYHHDYSLAVHSRW